MSASLLPIFIVPIVLQFRVQAAKVLIMNGDISGFTRAGNSYSISNGGILIEHQQFFKPNNDCIKRIIIRLNGVEAERLKVPCSYGIMGNGGNYQCVDAFTMVPEPGTNNFNGLYNLGGGNCIRRVYTTQENPKRVKILVDETVKDQICKDLPDGKDVVPNPFKNNGGMDFSTGGASSFNNKNGNIQIQEVSGGTFNMNSHDDDEEVDHNEQEEEAVEDEEGEDQNEDEENEEPTGSSKVLIMGGDVSGYRPGEKTNSFSNGRISTSEQKFYTGKNECVKRIIIGVNEVEAERVKVPCSTNLRGINGNYHCGNAFTLMPQPGTNNVKALYNIGEGNCIRRVYTTKGNPKRIQKLVDQTVKDLECKDLAEGKNMIPNPFDDGNGGMDLRKGSNSHVQKGNGKIQMQGVTGGTFNMGSQDHAQGEDFELDVDEDEEEDGEEDWEIDSEEDVGDEESDEEDVETHRNDGRVKKTTPH